MQIFFITLLIVILCIVIVMLAFIFLRKDIYDKLNAVFAMNTNIVLLLLLVGLIDGRIDMYMDIALSYAILGFVTTVMLAKYIGGHKK